MDNIHRKVLQSNMMYIHRKLYGIIQYIMILYKTVNYDSGQKIVQHKQPHYNTILLQNYICYDNVQIQVQNPATQLTILQPWQ